MNPPKLPFAGGGAPALSPSAQKNRTPAPDFTEVEYRPELDPMPSAPRSIVDYPFTSVLMGPPGCGKTTAALIAFLGLPVKILAQPNAVEKVVLDATDIDVSACVVPIYTLSEAIPHLHNARAEGYAAVVVDEASQLMANDRETSRQNYLTVKTHERTGQTREYVDRAWWGSQESTVTLFTTAVRHAGVSVVTTTGMQQPYDDDGLNASGKKRRDQQTGKQVREQHYPEGPNFHFRKMTEILPAAVDECVRVIPGPTGVRWDSRCDCDPSDPRSTMKTRFSRPLNNGPLNLAEMLRSSGYHVPRPQGLEWMEEIAEAVCASILSGEPEAEARRPFKEHLIAQGVGYKQIVWALADGTHRARFRRYRQASLLGSI